MTYRILRFLAKIFFYIFFFFKTSGSKHIPDNGGCIIASNHVSFLDPIALSIAIPRHVYFMAKDDLFQTSWFKKLLICLHTFPVKRGKSGDVKAIRLALNKLQEGKALIIFPEGSRSKTGKLKEAESGVGLLAAKSGVPVIPALVWGTEKGMPVGAKNIYLFQPISVHFGKPLYYKDLQKNSSDKNNFKLFATEILKAIGKIAATKTLAKN